MIKAATMVMARALKNPPVTPAMNARGKNTTIVAPVEPNSGRVISAAADNSDVGVVARPSCSRRITCSSITTASSTIKPTAAAMPPSVIMSKCMPSAYSSKLEAAKTAGRTPAVMAINRHERKNSHNTKPAKMAPRKMASRTALAAAVTNSD